MSRSYKKNPWGGDTKKNKREANQKVRRFLKNLENELKFSAYKKVYETWDICDYGEITTWKEYWQHCLRMYAKYPNLYKHPPNEKEEYRNWYKWYKMK